MVFWIQSNRGMISIGSDGALVDDGVGGFVATVGGCGGLNESVFVDDGLSSPIDMVAILRSGPT